MPATDPGVRRRDRISDTELYKRCGKEVDGEVEPLECIAVHWRRRVLRWLGHVARMEDCRIARQLMWARFTEGVGRPGRRTNPLLTQVYHDLLKTLDLTDARKTFQEDRAAQGRSRFGFCWMDACKDRDSWRSRVN